jgi:hypothetical protein
MGSTEEERMSVVGLEVKGTLIRADESNMSTKEAEDLIDLILDRIEKAGYLFGAVWTHEGFGKKDNTNENKFS